MRKRKKDKRPLKLRGGSGVIDVLGTRRALFLYRAENLGRLGNYSDAARAINIADGISEAMELIDKIFEEEQIEELKKALLVAAEALVIASDWILPAVQVYPPKEWALDSGGEDPAAGWCSTYGLAKKLRELVNA